MDNRNIGSSDSAVTEQATEEINPAKKTPLQIRQATLDQAKEYTSKDRNSAYGEPEDNFRNIATLWDAYLFAKYPGSKRFLFAPEDVAIMNILLKVARLSTNPTHKDSWIDTAGYAACGAGIALKGLD